MHFLLDLFGGSPLLYAGSLVALIAGLAVALKLIDLVAGRLAARRRAPPPRLALIESARVDRDRRVVLIRRDNVEYTILTGGPQDLVLEAAVPTSSAVTASAAEVPTVAPAATGAIQRHPTLPHGRNAVQAALALVGDPANPPPSAQGGSLARRTLSRR